MLKNQISAISFALLLILVSFTGCMDDSDSDSDDAEMPDVVIGPEVTTDDATDTNTTTDENQDDTPEVYDGPLRILALHGGGDTPEGLENQAGMQDRNASQSPAGPSSIIFSRSVVFEPRPLLNSGLPLIPFELISKSHPLF
tara:strand:- start:146 stop:571 length:426 start_codon:yes stop_codon:yes gene_type:complete